MFICKDSSQRYLLAVYWEDKDLFIVIKEMTKNRELVEHAALSFPSIQAQELMDDLTAGPMDLHGVHIDTLTATAMAGRIAEGLQKVTRERPKHVSRIRPEFWG